MLKPRRLTKTAVNEAIHETRTREFVDWVGDSEKLPDGRHEVAVRLFDAFDDPRSTPAGKSLIERLEASGWQVAHRHGRRFSVLTLSEPIADLPGEAL